MADLGRPKADDPKVQRAVYPPRSLWHRIEMMAAADRRPPAQFVVLLLEEAMEAREAKAAQ